MNLLFLGTPDDIPYVPRLKPMLTGHSTYVVTEKVTTITELQMYCAKRGITGVLTTQLSILARLAVDDPKPSIDNYAGSLFTRNDIDIVIINPLAQLFSVSYGKFLTERYISKLTSPEKWLVAPEFYWEVVTPSTAQSWLEVFSKATAIAVDIETIKEPLGITCIGYTAILLAPNGLYHTKTIVIPFTDEVMLVWAARFNALEVPKITQNGKYDNSYLLAYDMPLVQWYWDTANMMHCLYCELPKTLDALTAFFLREGKYWKHEAKGVSLTSQEYYHYNAMDTYNTACIFLAWILEAPPHAKVNYIKEFPINYPCILSEATGLKASLLIMQSLKLSKESEIDRLTKSLSASIGIASFNTNSHLQVKALMKILGCQDLAVKSSDEKTLKKAASRHALNAWFFNTILTIRKHRKVVSTNLVPEKLYRGRVLYALNPHATDTSRLASGEHHFWAGMNIQTMPRETGVKDFMCADTGFFLGEADFSQAESRATGYISGDTTLIANVESDKDFHSLNAAAFFGIPYDQIFRDITYTDSDGTLYKRGVINKPIRQLSKNTNHGANYNMGPDVMLDTMGEENVAKAKSLLGLPRFWTLRKVCEHLLGVFASTYPRVRNDYQQYVIYQVLTFKKLILSNGWTRICFGNPAKNKRDLNSYVANCPQGTIAQILNEAYLAVFYEVWLPNQNDFKLCAQIHDSILFQYRKGHDHLAYQVKAIMERPHQITDIAGTTRTMVIPVDLNLGLINWSKD
jgi:DNA polymerase I-like protein with 3'-5' exonuclease and polymerase domains